MKYEINGTRSTDRAAPRMRLRGRDDEAGEEGGIKPRENVGQDDRSKKKGGRCSNEERESVP